MSVQARWSHVPVSPLQSVSVSMPSQQKVEGTLPPQFNHPLPVDQSTANRFSETQASASVDGSCNIHVVINPTVTQLPEELGLVDTSSSSSTAGKTQSAVSKSLSLSNIPDAGKSDTGHNGGSSNGISQSTTSFKSQSSQQKNTSSHQHSGYSHQRGGGASHKNTSGGEWSQRRTGFHGRHQSFGAEKGFPPSKMRQIYVAKQTPSGSSTAPS